MTKAAQVVPARKMTLLATRVSWGSISVRNRRPFCRNWRLFRRNWVASGRAMRPACFDRASGAWRLLHQLKGVVPCSRRADLALWHRLCPLRTVACTSHKRTHCHFSLFRHGTARIFILLSDHDSRQQRRAREAGGSPREAQCHRGSMQLGAAAAGARPDRRTHAGHRYQHILQGGDQATGGACGPHQ